MCVNYTSFISASITKLLDKKYNNKTSYVTIKIGEISNGLAKNQYDTCVSNKKVSVTPRQVSQGVCPPLSKLVRLVY